MEIQVGCYATGMMRNDDSSVFTEKNYQTLRKALQSFVGDDIHDSPESLLHWGIRDSYSKAIGGCSIRAVGLEKAERNTPGEPRGYELLTRPRQS